jgi:sortase (surface protein transpeptidase)
MPSKTQNKSADRRPNTSRSPKPLISIKPQKSRVKKLTVHLNLSSDLVIGLRRFTTSKHRRSKKIRQVVFSFQLFSLKEIAIAKIKKPKKDWQNTILWLPRQVALFLLILLPVTNAAVFYNFYVGQTAQVEAIAVHYTTPKLNTKPKQAVKVLPKSEPVSLKVKAIGISSDIIPLGKYPDGEIEMPSYPELPGWYKYGPTPGEIGPAIIVGHLDTDTDVAVFWRLHELKAGDRVEVGRADGTTATFVVMATKQLPRYKFPTQEVYGNINYAGIRLITCGGTFNPTTLKYSHNTVVYGKLL